MSVATNLAILGALVGGSYLLVSHRAKRRVRPKKKPPTRPPPVAEVYPLMAPPNPGDVLPAHTEHDVNMMIEQLRGVPTAVLMAFSKGPVYQKVRPYLLDFANAYPEIQFVESHLDDMLGTTSNVVVLDVGLDLGKGSPHTAGISLLMTDGPETAVQKLETAGEAAEPKWSPVNSDTRDMLTVQGDWWDALETLADRLAAVPRPTAP